MSEVCYKVMLYGAWKSPDPRDNLECVWTRGQSARAANGSFESDRIYAPPSYRKWYGGNVLVLDEFDEFVAVTEDDVPDEVWAAAMREQLA